MPNTTQNKEELNKCLHEHLTCPGDITTVKCAYCGKTMYKQEPEKWEKECKQEFIETFEYCEKYGLDTKDIISSLGIGVCKQERQRLIEEVRELVDGMRKNTTLSHACLQSWGGCDCNDNKNYNQALDDLLQELNKLKGIK